MTLIVAVALLLLVAVAGTAQADFSLTGEEHMDVTSYHSLGELYDTSTADVLEGGSIFEAYVYNTAKLRVLEDGCLVSELHTCNSGVAGVCGGDIYDLYAGDTSRVSISGGRVDELYANGSSRLAMSGGSITWRLNASNSSSIGICGGSVWSLFAGDTSKVRICGGTVSMMYPGGSSHVSICGGTFPLFSTSGSASVGVFGGDIFQLYAGDTSSIMVRGHDFEVTGGLSLDGDRVVGTGVLSGTWWGGAPWTMSIVDNGADATIWADPTPPHPGDANFDDVVDVSDLGILAMNWGKSARYWCHADFTGNGTVNVGDLGVLAFNWGWDGHAVAAMVAAPEPAILTLLATGALSMLRRRR
jgi:hypothetical protein